MISENKSAYRIYTAGQYKEVSKTENKTVEVPVVDKPTIDDEEKEDILEPIENHPIIIDNPEPNNPTPILPTEIERSENMPSQENPVIKCIQRVIDFMVSTQLIPQLPPNTPLFSNEFLNTTTTLTLNDLQNMFDRFYQTLPVYQNTATYIQVLDTGKLFPIALTPIDDPASNITMTQAEQDALTFNLMDNIKRPSLTIEQRQIIKARFKTILANEPILSTTWLALDKTLSSINPGPTLTKDCFQQIVTLFNEKWRRLTINPNANFPIPLNEQNLLANPTYVFPSTINQAILPLGLTYQNRIETGLQILQRCALSYQNIPEQKLATFEEQLSSLQPDATGQLSAAQLKQLRQLLPAISYHASSQARVIQTRSNYCCGTVQRLVNYENEGITKDDVMKLVTSRSYYINTRDNAYQALIYSGLIIGALTSMLEGVRQKATISPSVTNNLNFTLLIVPILLGLASKICDNIRSDAENKLDLIDGTLRNMGVFVEDGEPETPALDNDIENGVGMSMR